MEFSISVLFSENTQDVGIAEIKRKPGGFEVEEVNRLKDRSFAETHV